MCLATVLSSFAAVKTVVAVLQLDLDADPVFPNTCLLVSICLSSHSLLCCSQEDPSGENESKSNSGEVKLVLAHLKRLLKAGTYRISHSYPLREAREECV